MYEPHVRTAKCTVSEPAAAPAILTVVLASEIQTATCYRTVGMIKKQKGMKLVRSGRGRSRQMNAGAAVASGTYICFVHADSRPCKDAVNVVRCVSAVLFLVSEPHRA